MKNTPMKINGMEYADRKEYLDRLYRNKFAALVKADVDRLEA